MFDSLLIANRGEIACRIIRTARRMGLRTVAVYSEADRDALHVRMADQAILIGPAPAGESYLRTDRILEAAKRTGAEAIHPGYGFLSEQPALVRGCNEAGFVWVGPHLGAITSMGSKIEAKRIALDAGVPCIPGTAGESQDDADLIAAAEKIGLPVMVKASAGGGGKGMRAVFEAIDLPSAITSARTEAARSFGDDRLMVEKLVQNPRHIEVQLLGDKHGNLIHLFERDCSIQRNHQKIIEEAPAPNLKDATRRALFEAALGLGRAIGYDSTGTVEFVMDAVTEEFYFLEVNTRLQVEHTVTEEITGLDLVEQQLKVAAGEPLELAQEQVTATGHAIEARLTAEDASDSFRPQTGTVLHWRVGGGLRCDGGIAAGSTVGSSYDSLVAKLIAHGNDREEARRKLAGGLEQLEIAGLKTNRIFLRDILRTNRFRFADVTTDFLRREWSEGWRQTGADSHVWAVLAHHLKQKDGSSPWQSLGGFRMLGSAGRPARASYVDATDPESRVTVTRDRGGFVLHHAAGEDLVEAEWAEPGVLRVTRDGVAEDFSILFDGGQVHASCSRFDAAHEVMFLGDYNAAQRQSSTAAPDRIAATMPGLIVEVRAQEGAEVEAGETLVVMESMKLLMDLKAAASGTVTAVNAAPGDTVDAGALILQLALSEEEEG